MNKKTVILKGKDIYGREFEIEVYPSDCNKINFITKSKIDYIYYPDYPNNDNGKISRYIKKLELTILSGIEKYLSKQKDTRSLYIDILFKAKDTYKSIGTLKSDKEVEKIYLDKLTKNDICSLDDGFYIYIDEEKNKIVISKNL